MPENSSEKSGANADEADTPAPLGLKKWRAAPDDLEGLERYQLRAMKAAELAMYRAGEEGDRAGVVKASNQLTKAVTGYRKLLDAQRERESVLSLSEGLRMMDALADELLRIFDRYDMPAPATKEVIEFMGAQAEAAGDGYHGDGAPPMPND